MGLLWEMMCVLWGILMDFAGGIMWGFYEEWELSGIFLVIMSQVFCGSCVGFVWGLVILRGFYWGSNTEVRGVVE